MHCQNSLCLNAINCLFFAKFSKGFSSKTVLSLLRYLNIFLLKTKNPPFIHPSPDWGFSENLETLFPLIFKAPNLAEGITAVTVPIFFVLSEI